MDDQLQKQERTPKDDSQNKQDECQKPAEQKRKPKQSTTMQISPKESKKTSKVLQMVKGETTYNLTGSKFFWQIDDQGEDTGKWRP